MKALALLAPLLGGALLFSACQASNSGVTLDPADAFATVTLQFDT